MSRLLVVEDDPDIARALRLLFSRAGYDVAHAGDGRTGLKEAYAEHPDLVVLDVGLPEMDGWQVLERLRDVSDVPVLVLTAHGQEAEKVRGLRGGADDYLTKPFANNELLARVEALLRRSRERPAVGLVRVGELEIDPVSREVRVAGTVAPLSAKEFALLLALAAEPTRVFTKEELLRNVWGFRAMGSNRTLDSHACRLRQKL